MPGEVDFLARIRIEPLDRAKHDRTAFLSGEPRVDTYLKTRAAGLMDVDATRVWVASLDGTTEIVGYFAMNAHTIDASDLPASLRKRLPQHHPIPAMFLSYIGVSSAYQRRGIGAMILAEAFVKAVLAADVIGAAFIVLDALSEDAARFYRRHGFTDLPSPPGRMIIGLRQVRVAIAAAASEGPS